MNHFPILCVDDFYDNPNEVREYALTQEYAKIDGHYPGVRTEPLHKINPKFFDLFCKRLFSIFYEYRYENINWSVESYFQKIYPYDPDPTSPMNEGWIHLDSDTCISAGVIYLTPEANLDSGTSFFKKLDDTPTDWTIRNKLYLGQQVDKLEYIKQKDKNNFKYKKILEIKNIFNRLSFYGSQYPHKENNFYAHKEEPRLTQVFFIHSIECLNTPILRKNNYEIKF